MAVGGKSFRLQFFTKALWQSLCRLQFAEITQLSIRSDTKNLSIGQQPNFANNLLTFYGESLGHQIQLITHNLRIGSE
tara:strand:+ start:692 stop:925 length:234 start_codon:yes stop_codon:yes gene_type:complete